MNGSSEQHRYANELKKTASVVLNCTHEQLSNRELSRHISIRRFMVWKYLYEVLRFKKVFITDVADGRHWTTILEGIRTINNVLQVDTDIQKIYTELTDFLAWKGYGNAPVFEDMIRYSHLSTQQVIAIKNLFSTYSVKKVFYDRYGFQHSELATMLLKKKYNAKLRDRMKVLLADADKLLRAN